jgi:hypothetical protein
MPHYKPEAQASEFTVGLRFTRLRFGLVLLAPVTLRDLCGLLSVRTEDRKGRQDPQIEGRMSSIGHDQLCNR